jgi:beta-glucosidase
MKKGLFALIMVFTINAIAQDAKMKTFIDGLMRKMTLNEKIGQLNLLTPGSGILQDRL